MTCEAPNRRAVVTTAMSAALLIFWASFVSAQTPETPLPTDLVEETGHRLVQLDVTVSGPRAAITDLTREDFELIVASRRVDVFTVDNLCRLPDGEVPFPQAPSAEDTWTDRPVPATRPPVSYLFYFEQNNLTVQGRVRALDTARGLVDELIVDGNLGMVVSSGRDLRTFVELTAGKAELLDGIDRLERDQHHWWDPNVEDEDNRIGRVLEKMAERPAPASYDKNNAYQEEQERQVREKVRRSNSAALVMARQFQVEERWRTEKSLQLFALVLGRMADLSAPKAVVYFADTTRSNAGEHYLSFFGDKVRKKYGGLTAAHAFESVIDGANAQGIRVYAVQAQGLVTETSVAYEAGGNTQRFRDAENSLVGLGLETGGAHFLRGRRTTRIAEEIRSDLDCLYLLSFDPVGYHMDRPLPVAARVLRPGVKLKVRGRVVVQSEARRLQSRLLAAFAVGGSGESGFSMGGSVIPTGFDKGKYSALVQLHVPGSPLVGTTWDLGLSLVSRGSVREDASGRVTVNGPSLPVVFETQMTFRPGPYEIVSVAHEQTGDDVVTHRISGEWPDADDAPASLGPIAVLQPEDGAFLRDDDLRRTGSLAVGANGFVRPDRPTAVVGIVCRGRTQQRPFVVERHLVGESAVDFAPLELDLGEDRCAVFQDIVKAGTMTDGGFQYQVHVMRGEEKLAAAAREFVVVSDATSGPSGL